MRKKLSLFFTIGFLVMLFYQCASTKEPDNSGDSFSIYVGQDSLTENENYYKMFPTVDTTVSLEGAQNLTDSIQVFCNIISKKYFRSLKIEFSRIDQIKYQKVLYLNLQENENYTTPSEYKGESWYQYFQGSTGGNMTMITLVQSLLQMEFKGTWIDVVIYSYQGKEMGEWDSVNLRGSNDGIWPDF
jgi:hypothetical protein